ncbi:MAG: hypothetical protein KAI22_09630 [Gammaproteobacteria bacterium]|nr:hypothetical protein [Gammaproteobacteria bacterium]
MITKSLQRPHLDVPVSRAIGTSILVRTPHPSFDFQKSEIAALVVLLIFGKGRKFVKNQ